MNGDEIPDVTATFRRCIPPFVDEPHTQGAVKVDTAAVFAVYDARTP